MKLPKLSTLAAYIPFVILFIFLIILYQAVPKYWDDFGYTALQYAPGGAELPWVNTKGANWTFATLWEYCGLMYQWWSGRVLFNGLIYIPLLRLLPIMRLVIALATVIAFWQLTRLAKIELSPDKMILSLFGVALWFALPLEAYSNQWFWYAASSGFVMPLPFFLGTLLLIRDLKKSSRLVAACMCGAITGFSSELIALTLCGVLFLKFITGIHGDKNSVKADDKREKVATTSNGWCDWHFLLVCLCSVFGTAFLYFAPGNWVRAGTSSKLHTTSELIQFWTSINFGKDAICFTLFLCLLTCLLAWWLHERKHLPIFAIIWSVVTLIIPWINLEISSKAFLRLISMNGYAYFAFSGYCIALYLKRYKSRTTAFLLISALAATLTPIVYSYDILPRMQVQLYLALFIVALEFLAAIGETNKKVYHTIFMTALCAIVVYRGVTLMVGYYGNKGINDYNNSVLQEAAAEYEKTQALPEYPVFLYTLPDYRFAPRLPYPNVNTEYTACYGLPDDYPIVTPFQRQISGAPQILLQYVAQYPELVNEEGQIVLPDELILHILRTEEKGIDPNTMPVEAWMLRVVDKAAKSNRLNAKGE